MSKDGYDHQVERVARGVGVGSAGQGVGRLLGYATHASVAWMYGPAQLGFYALGITVVQVASILSQLGLYPSDRLFLASFAGALKNALGREPVR